nr:immunoglobulin light chain junction region [Macaca mulatta]MOX78043.1 immunoglobulin light chain junction region [Macaca mulatta]MOX78844.1 immunoglobulin light chain junction region [Macaca mulatta]MOX80361.1 immunoglobulin light chain junction region [Macaca mulatta]MOX81125.1 immunoglobulin light chain junction region [Macaca mulatta]
DYYCQSSDSSLNALVLF